MKANLAKVISGGQDGVDIAGLRAAKFCGIPTGGTMTKDWATHSGPKPEYAQLYGMVAHRSSEYAARTGQNVRDADLTVRIYENPHSSGERCTLTAIGKRPFRDLRLVRQGGKLMANMSQIDQVLEAVEQLTKKYGRKIVLNIAGNSERTAPGIERFAEKLLIDMFHM